MATNILCNRLGALLFLLAIHAFTITSVQNEEGKTMGLDELRSYLWTFGYLNDSSSKNSSNFNSSLEFDEVLETALKSFQKIYHLNVTGKLDSTTVDLISTPRCGMPKNFVNLNATEQPKNPAAPYALSMACRQAFDLWAEVTNFTFQQVVPSSPADILISFQRRDHGDGSPFDGAGKVLAHAFAPTDGRLHLDGDENWSFRPPSKNQYDLVWVATHELGHVLGLQHSTLSDAIMYAYVGAGKTRRALHSDDIAGIKALYQLQP
ncbi:metalloendoproteinase 1-like [Pyrus ussuriensis x Pyrus communis]|uniref:Metalloendoproteinase 1-like n=1 Tax=Pyrus ussuriensis x Pyrus communis TaxID=2448454 RepID=A0A5N5GIS1_9ROSA|nr:metalloendoproteinase 1-like [Pyrus ussuriensis x Pyrus communis]